MLVFPEGTTTNGTSLIRYQLGAFRLNSSVQPLAIRYNWTGVNPNWTAEGAGGHFMRLAGKLRFCSITVTLMPSYHPTEEEKGNPIVSN